MKSDSKHKKNNKTPWWTNVSSGIYSTFTLIVFVLCLLGTWIPHACKKTFPLPNIICFLIGIILISVFGILSFQFVQTKFYDKYERLLLPVASLLFLIYILFASRFYYFVTGWDAGNVITNAQNMASGLPIDELYYSEYPNNITMTILFSFILKAYSTVTGKEWNYYALVAFQCFGIVLSGYLTYYSAKNLTGKKEISILSWVLFLFLAVLSPWVVVPYSDIIGLIVLSVALFLYSYRKLPVLLGISFILCYYIKPTAFILAIAVTLCSLPTLKNTIRGNKKELIRIGMVVLGVFIGFGIVKLGIFSRQIALDHEKTLDMTHFLMMGLNEETDGVFDTNDVLFSESIELRDERHKQNLQVTINRLENMTPCRMAALWARKVLVAFDDGTFAWATEGNFFYIPVYTGHERIESFYHNLFYPDGDFYSVYLLFSQSVWLASLGLLTVPFMIRFFKKEFREADLEKKSSLATLSPLALTVIGNIIYEILFEPRARHLLVCLPVMLILAAAGFYSTAKLFPRQKKNE